MNKKILSMFVFMLVLMPFALLAGCSGTQNPPPATYKVTATLQNATAGITLEPLENENFEEGSNVDITVKFDAGYRPEGLVATSNGSTITGAITQTNGEAYTQDTPLSAELYWKYTIKDLSANTTILINVADCTKATLEYSFDNEYTGELYYAVLNSKPDETLTSQSQIDDYLASQNSNVNPIAEKIIVPYGSFVILLSSADDNMMYLTSTDSSNSKFEILSACFDNARQQYFTYSHAGKDCQVFTFTANNEQLDSFQDIFISLTETNNVISNTFAFSPVNDGTDIRQMSTSSNIPTKLISTDQSGNPQTHEINLDGTTKTYYRLTNTNTIYAYIGSSDLTDAIQQNYASAYSQWIDDYVAFEINGFGSFDETDRYYLSTELNYESSTAHTYDVTHCIKKVTTDYAPRYFFIMSSQELTDMVSQNPQFIKTIKGNEYGFAYLLYDKNQNMSEVHEFCLEGYNFVELNPQLQVCGNSGIEDNAFINDTRGNVTYVDYTITNDNQEITPVYYMNTYDFSINRPINVSLYFMAPILKIVDANFVMYSGYNYTVSNSLGETLASGTYTYTSADLSNLSGAYKNIELPNFYNTDYYKISLQFTERPFDDSTHTIQNGSDRQIYYYLANADDDLPMPTDASAWKDLATNPITIKFDNTKLLYVLTELSNTDSKKEEINIQYQTPIQPLDTEYRYETISTLHEYSDLFGNKVSMTIDGKTYQVYVVKLVPSYYVADMEYFIRINEVVEGNEA